MPTDKELVDEIHNRLVELAQNEPDKHPYLRPLLDSQKRVVPMPTTRKAEVLTRFKKGFDRMQAAGKPILAATSLKTRKTASQAPTEWTIPPPPNAELLDRFFDQDTSMVHELLRYTRGTANWGVRVVDSDADEVVKVHPFYTEQEARKFFSEAMATMMARSW